MHESMGDVVFVSLEDWDEIWRRNQFLCAEIARRHPERKILFVGRARDFSHSLRRGKLSGLRPDGPQRVKGLDNIHLTNAPKLFPNTLTAGRKLNEALERSHIRRAARQLGITRPLLWLNPHLAVNMVGQMHERAVVYDITDDWISFGQSEWLRKLTEQQDAELCRKADAVIVCSERLYELKRSLASNLHLIPNGVDAHHYRVVLDGNGPLPALVADWKKPVLGYTGTIHPDRVDVEMVASLAAHFPHATIALVGPNMLPAADVRRLEALGNVGLTGPVPYADVPKVMRAFDVCITPHRMTPFTESLNPIKLWEYLAAGKPIVSTDVAGFRDYRQFVRIARDAGEFASAVGDALNENRGIAEARRDEAARHSWHSRVDEIDKIIAACLQMKDAAAHAR